MYSSTSAHTTLEPHRRKPDYPSQLHPFVVPLTPYTGSAVPCVIYVRPMEGAERRIQRRYIPIRGRYWDTLNFKPSTVCTATFHPTHTYDSLWNRSPRLGSLAKYPSFASSWGDAIAAPSPVARLKLPLSTASNARDLWVLWAECDSPSASLRGYLDYSPLPARHPMTPLDPLHQLRDLDRASPQFHAQFRDFLRGNAYQNALPNLENESLAWLVEYLDSVGL